MSIFSNFVDEIFNMFSPAPGSIIVQEQEQEISIKLLEFREVNLDHEEDVKQLTNFIKKLV